MTTGRVHGLDACRAAAMMLGLFFHGAISFLETPIPWAIRDRSTDFGVDALVWICHTFRMPVFFLLAGFFGRLLYVKLGPVAFLRHRAKRLLVPFVVTLVPLMPTLFFLWQWGMARQPNRGPWVGLDATSIHPGEMRPNPGHLWFLYYLMMILGAMVLILIAARQLPFERVLQNLDRFLGALIRLRLVLFVMAIPTAATLHPMISLSADTPFDFVPQLRILAYYFVFVSFGWLLHRQPDLVAELGRGLWIPLGLAVITIVPLSTAVEKVVQYGRPLNPLVWIVSLYLSGLFGWSMVILFLGAFVKWGERQRPWVSYLSDASYWCYLVHLPVVVALQILAADLEWPGLLKYAMIMTATIAVCLGTYQAFVRYTFIGTTLNGRRERPEPAPVSP
ncbi:MAG: acyltransferase family protein [Planctomycetes bacterium]|nr:acyltransferase family protein [Planctomycetota bacterium]